MRENKFDSVAEKVGTKDVNVINQNISIYYITEHAEIVESRVKAKTEKLQSKKQRKNQKKFNKVIHTLADLQKDTSNIDKSESVSSKIKTLETKKKKPQLKKGPRKHN